MRKTLTPSKSSTWIGYGLGAALTGALWVTLLLVLGAVGRLVFETLSLGWMFFGYL
jgi:hypothetical protein